MTLAPGVYKWGTGLSDPDRRASHRQRHRRLDLPDRPGSHHEQRRQDPLAGGALPKNVFWQVAGLVDLGTTAHFEGVVLDQTAITLRTGASINGRLLAQTAVSLDGSTVVEPAQ